MYIEKVPNRNSPPAILVREAYRENGKVKKRTLANVTTWPAHVVEGLRVLFRGGSVSVDSQEGSFEIVRSLPHGHVAAVLGTIRDIGLDGMIGARRTPERDRVLALITSRILDPGSKLALARGLGDETASSTLGEILDVQNATEDELYAAMDWLLERQGKIEKSLSKRHLSDGSLVLYDLTSTYFEGTSCPLAQLGYSRDGKKGTLQIVFGLLCNSAGCPVAVEVFEGNTADPKTLGTQIEKIRTKFSLRRVVLVGDRGMLTEARIREELREVEGLDWITALRGPAIKDLMEGGALQLSLLDKRNLCEIRHPDYPGERLIACYNPLLADRRANKRKALLEATERELVKVVEATKRTRNPLRGADKIGLRVGRVLGTYKMAKHFEVEILDDTFAFSRKEEGIAAEAVLDGIYVVRTSVAPEVLDTEATVGAYKGLSVVERAFRSMKTVDLKVRPIYHHLESRVRAHVFLCMLAYYVEWHMRAKLAPILFDDDDKESAKNDRKSIVAPAQRSKKAKRKADTGRTENDLPVHSFRSLLSDLATIVKSHIQPNIEGAGTFEKVTVPTPLQKTALDLLGVKL